MANNFDLVLRNALWNMLTVLREMAVMPRLGTIINSENPTVALERGQTVRITRPKPQVASAVSASATDPTPNDIAVIEEDVTVDQWYGVPWAVTDKELHEVAFEGIVQGVTLEAVRAIANQIDAHGISKLKIGAFQQVAKTSTATDDLVDLDMKFRLNKAPNVQKSLVCDATAWAFLMKNSNIFSAAVTGDVGAVQRGELRNRFGFENLVYSQNMDGVGFTAGTGSGYQVDGSGSPIAVGTHVIAADTGSGTILAGDIVTFAGHSQQYNVTKALSGGTFQIYPALQAQVADNGAITVVASTATTMSIALQKMGLAYLFRPERPAPGTERITVFQTVTDPITGLNLTLELKRQAKRTLWWLTSLWGTGQILRDCVVKYKTS